MSDLDIRDGKAKVRGWGSDALGVQHDVDGSLRPRGISSLTVLDRTQPAVVETCEAPGATILQVRPVDIVPGLRFCLVAGDGTYGLVTVREVREATSTSSSFFTLDVVLRRT
ncbi:hypothetical protein DEJ50_06170 [Streptomyces venezuelae]|uniref:Phage tail protein n=1 Tax=Streptomyces venezuelae TaxID=54571 RepID=A0A5P2CYD9_STRVZ|nr:hypothetical protein [Streptomyces venezuelae]QES47473.1 hypothetical protein DEJ50_06170 [Streptomyces venezuelae]